MIIEDLIEEYKSNTTHIFTIEDFKSDFDKFLNIKRILRKYKKTNKIKIRIFINDLILLYNVFDNKTTKVLIDIVDADCIEYLLAGLKFLSRLPDSYKNSYNSEFLLYIESNI